MLFPLFLSHSISVTCCTYRTSRNYQVQWSYFPKTPINQTLPYSFACSNTKEIFHRVKNEEVFLSGIFCCTQLASNWRKRKKYPIQFIPHNWMHFLSVCEVQHIILISSFHEKKSFEHKKYLYDVWRCDFFHNQRRKKCLGG